MSEGDLLEVFLREELRLANRHAPRARVSICDLLKEEVPHVVTYDGGIHVMSPRELSLLNEIVKGDCNLKLPIVIEYMPEGEGIYIVQDPVAAKVVAELIGLSSHSTPLLLHRPQVMELRTVLRTTTVILISPRFLTVNPG